MNDLEYKKQILDTKSASFCAAKWYNATIWLGSGMTTSCHHPLPHKIDLEEIKTNPSASPKAEINKLAKYMLYFLSNMGCVFKSIDSQPSKWSAEVWSLVGSVSAFKRE